MKRIFLFVVTNLAVLALLTLVLFIVEQVFGVRLAGGRLGQSAGFCGDFRLRRRADFAGPVQMDRQAHDGGARHRGAASELERWLLGTVNRLADQVHVGMPEVGIFDAEEMNAFATGARRNAALVAVSSGLLRNMSRAQVEAVLGHEITPCRER